MFDKTKLREVLGIYKKQFPKWWEDEKFKWQAVKYFQANWNIEDENFLEMINTSLNNGSIYYGLLTSSNRFPVGMLIEFSKRSPETVRSMFIDLFDESKDVWERINNFKSKSKKLLQGFFRSLRKR